MNFLLQAVITKRRHDDWAMITIEFAPLVKSLTKCFDCGMYRDDIGHKLVTDSGYQECREHQKKFASMKG